MSSKKSKSKTGRSSEDEGKTIEEHLTSDPYVTIWNPSSVCNAADHARKKNCAKNPWCLYGLGERDGIWKNNTQIIGALGHDVSLHLRAVDPSDPKAQRLLPPTGLRNLGATCYLNVLIQSLFHNILVQDAVLNMQVAEPTPGKSASSTPDDATVMREVILELQRAFTHMKMCRYGTFDLSRFVGLLQLDKSTQQDPQEFNKLFLSKIESCKFQSRNEQRTRFGDLLRGRMKYSTTCLGCQQVSSPPEHDFHELDLSIEGAHSVEEALQQYLGVEELCKENDNQYDCGNCGGRRNAQRAVGICSTPSMLCLHLLRYGYDRKTFERKKLTNEVTFPDVLEVCGEQYRLTSVLYHKGRSAYGGHYVCDALDWETGQWWHFDDDVVSRTVNPALAMTKGGGQEEKGPAQSSSKADPRAKKRAASPLAVVLTEDGVDGEDVLEDSDYEPVREQTGGRNSSSKRKRQQPTTGGLVDLATNSSTTAVRKKASTQASEQRSQPVEVDLTDETPASGAGATAGTDAGNPAVGKATVNRKRDTYMLTYMKVVDFEAGLRCERCAPSEELVADAQASSEAFLRKVHAYEEAKTLVLAEAAERRKVYNAIRDHLPAECQISPLPGHLHVAHHKNFHLVPAEWLHRWIKGDPSTFKSIAAIRKDQLSPAFTDTSINSEVVLLATQPAGGGGDELIPVQRFLCPHGLGLDVAHQEKFKVLSDVAYEAVFKSDHTWQQMDTELTHENYRCQRCVDGIVDHRIAAHTQAGANARILGLIEATSAEDGGHGATGSSRTHRRTTNRNGLGSPDDSAAHMDDRDSPVALEEPHAPAYWLHKAWLTQFKKLTASLEKAESSKAKKPAAPLAPMFTQFITPASADASAVAVNKDVEILTPPSPALDPSINTALFCAHGMPALNFTKKAIKVSTAAWEALCGEFPQAKAIELTEICCVRCEHDVRTQTEQLASNKEQRSQETARPPLAALWSAKRIYPDALDAITADEDVIEALPSALYAVDGKWLAHWRKYAKDPNFPAPAPLTNTKLRCQHGKSFLPLAFGSLTQGVPMREHEPSSLLVYKFQEEDLGMSEEETRYSGAASLARTETLPIAELITETQWRNLLEFHGPRPVEQETATTVDPGRELEEGEVLSSSEVAALTEAIGHEAVQQPEQQVFSCRLVDVGTSNGMEGKNSRWRWEPEVCGACLAEHESQKEVARTAYVNATVQVCYLRDDQEYLVVFGKSPPHGHSNGDGKTTAVAQASTVPTRTSKRTRGRRSTSTIIADSADSLAIVRLKVFEAFSRLDLPPNKQLLFDGRGEALASHTMTLVECGVKSTDTIYVMECAAGAEDWGLADCFNAPSSHVYERGFSGTLLTRSEGGGSAGSNADSTTGADELGETVKTDPPQKRRRGEEQNRDSSAAATGKRTTNQVSQVCRASTDDADLDRALKLSVESAKREGLHAAAGSYSAGPTAEVYNLLEDSQASAPPQTPLKFQQEETTGDDIVPLSEDALQSLLGGSNGGSSSGSGSGSSDGAYAGSHAQPIDIQDSP